MLNTVRLALIGVVVFVQSQTAFVFAEEDVGEFKYLYVSLNPPVKGFGILIKSEEWRLFYDGEERRGEFSRPDATDFQYLRLEGENGFQFAYPVGRETGDDSWRFKDCHYEILDKSRDFHDINPDRETATTLFTIQSDCAFSRLRALYLYQEAGGLVGFVLSESSTDDANGGYNKVQTFVPGLRAGFGSLGAN